MRGRLRWLGMTVLAGPVTATVTVGAWTPLFPGVERATGEADQAEARLQKGSAVRVDLRDPDIEFFSTPSNGERPLETTSERTSEFLVRPGLQVAINADFFTPGCAPGEKDLTGWAMSRGEAVSPPEARHNGAGVLLLTRDNRATIAVLNATALPTGEVGTAIGGSGVVLVGGEKPALPTKEFSTLAHPRSAVGVTKDGRYLLLVAIDGRQSGHSDGATLAEVADGLRRFGAHDGINLAGGGSTTLVVATGGGARGC